MKKFEFTGETKTISLLFRTATLHRAAVEVARLQIDLSGEAPKDADE